MNILVYMRIKKTILTAASLLAAVGLSLPHAELQAQNQSAGINLSIWKGISTQPADSTQTTYFNIGFQSTMNRLNGLGMNVLVGAIHKDMNGVQISGIANMVGKSMRGVQFSGITNISGNNMVGLAATGLVNITGNGAKGVLLSGMTNIAGDNSAGAMLSGLMNITGDAASGIQVSGLANITGDTFDGVMASGLLNVVGDHTNGIQFAGIGNITGKQLNGMQIGMFNYATKAHGVQIGLVNYYREEMQGFQLGLVNANPQTNVQMMVYGGNASLFNVGARFKNELFYTILGVGAYDQNLNDKFSTSFSYRAGLALPLYKGLAISGDLGYQHIEAFKNRNEVIPRRLYALQGRVNLEYQFTEKFGIFATGGYGLTRLYHQSHNFDKGAIIEAGIILF